MIRPSPLVMLLVGAAVSAPLGPGRAEAPSAPGFRVPSEPVMAPDGKRMLFTLTGTDPRQRAERARVWFLDPGGPRVLQRLGALLGGNPPERPAPRPLTRSDEDAGSPAFTPDGGSVSFLSARGERDRPQVWVLPLVGGEAERWTDAPRGVAQYAWAPDGSLVWRDGTEGAGTLWRTRPGEWEAVRLSGGAGEVTDFALSWAGVRVVLTTAGGEVRRLDLEDGAEQSLARLPAGARCPRWSHDEQRIYFLAASDPERGDSPDGVWSVPAAGGPVERVSGALAVEEIATCAESDRIYLVAEDGPDARPQRIIPASGRVEPLTDQPGRAADLTVRANGEKAAFVWRAPDEAPEIATWTFPDDYVEPLTALNAAPAPPAPAENGEAP